MHERKFYVMRENGEWHVYSGKIPRTAQTEEEVAHWFKEEMKYDMDCVFMSFQKETPSTDVKRITYTLPNGEDVELKKPDLKHWMDDYMINRWIKQHIEGVTNIKIERKNKKDE